VFGHGDDEGQVVVDGDDESQVAVDGDHVFMRLRG